MGRRKGKKRPHIYREREFLEWRDRILEWPVATDQLNPPKVSDLPEAYQRQFVKRMLERRRTWAGADDFCHRILEDED